MFDGRIYRVAFVPLLFVLVVVGFSLAGRPPALHSTLAPDAFDGPRAFAELQALVKRFPVRRPGGAGDEELAAYVAQALRGAGSGGGPEGAFQVSAHRFRAQTVDGARTLTTVIAKRPGSTGLAPIALVAHRDAVGRGAAAELSGTAALLELARVFSQSETRRTIVIVSTSGGSGGDAGAADFAGGAGHALDAAIVLGDLAGAGAHMPFVLPFSDTQISAPESLRSTLEGAIGQEVGVAAGTPSVATQLAHLAFPSATGEEAPLDDAGTPAVLLQVGGERGPSSGERVSESRLSNFGRAALSATYALDEGPDLTGPSAARLLLGRKTLPAWAIRLLALALLLPPLIVCVDALARLRRRKEPLGRWVAWTLTGSLPFLVAGLFAILLGGLGIVAAPLAQLPAASLAADGSAAGALASTLLVLALGLLAWPGLMRRLALPPRPCADGAGLVALLVALMVALVAWIFDPFACLLLIPALHLWLLAADPRPRGRPLALAAIAASVVPVVLLLLVYARELGLGPVGLAESAVLALAGGQVGLLTALLWSLALGCLLAMLARALAPDPVDLAGGRDLVENISTRGPLSYAGPGSLGGTESALRR
ncbi:MAG TPA: M28 family peptidase [Solirubrobacteraceae bacterium]|jgi:hypothetical protein